MRYCESSNVTPAVISFFFSVNKLERTNFTETMYTYIKLAVDRDGNFLTALAIGRVPLINATKSLVLSQVVLTLAWAIG